MLFRWTCNSWIIIYLHDRPHYSFPAIAPTLFAHRRGQCRLSQIPRRTPAHRSNPHLRARTTVRRCCDRAVVSSIPICPGGNCSLHAGKISDSLPPGSALEYRAHLPPRRLSRLCRSLGRQSALAALLPVGSNRYHQGPGQEQPATLRTLGRSENAPADYSSDSAPSPSATGKTAAGASGGFRGLLSGHHLLAGQHPLSGRLGFVARRHPHPDERGAAHSRSGSLPPDGGTGPVHQTHEPALH